MPTESTSQALAILRDTSQFSWYVIPLLLIVIYVYAQEADRGNWSRFLAGLAFWGMDWFNEIWNSLVFHFTQHAPVWAAPGDTAFLIFIGLNVEICFMFAISGIVATLALPKDPKMKVLGLNNRWFFAILFSMLSVLVEITLNHIGALTWEWSWWNADAPWLLFSVGYLSFYSVCYWVYDMPSRKKQIQVVGGLYAINIIAIVVFGGVLGWI